MLYHPAPDINPLAPTIIGDGTLLANIDTFKYLDSYISQDGSLNKQDDDRTSKTSQALGRLWNRNRSTQQCTSLLCTDAQCGSCTTATSRNLISFTCGLFASYLESRCRITSQSLIILTMRIRLTSNQCSSRHKSNRLVTLSAWRNIVLGGGAVVRLFIWQTRQYQPKEWGQNSIESWCKIRPNELRAVCFWLITLGCHYLPIFGKL